MLLLYGEEQVNQSYFVEEVIQTLQKDLEHRKQQNFPITQQFDILPKLGVWEQSSQKLLGLCVQRHPKIAFS